MAIVAIIAFTWYKSRIARHSSQVPVMATDTYPRDSKGNFGAPIAFEQRPVMEEGNQMADPERTDYEPVGAPQGLVYPTEGMDVGGRLSHAY